MKKESSKKWWQSSTKAANNKWWQTNTGGSFEKPSLIKNRDQLLNWLDHKANEEYGEFGFTTCTEDQQVDIIYDLLSRNVYTKS